MLFHVEMTVKLPSNIDPTLADRLKADEKQRALELQRAGKWRHFVAHRRALRQRLDI